jgi:hypothetical protein
MKSPMREREHVRRHVWLHGDGDDRREGAERRRRAFLHVVALAERIRRRDAGLSVLRRAA